MAGLGVVQSHAVEQDQYLTEGGATDRKIGLDSVGRARLEIERRIELQQVKESARGEMKVLRVDDVNGAVGFFQRNWHPSSGDDNRFCLREKRRAEEKQDG